MENERLACLLYLLMRDDVVPGRIEQLVLSLPEPGPTCDFSNRHLEAYARELAKRVMSGED